MKESMLFQPNYTYLLGKDIHNIPTEYQLLFIDIQTDEYDETDVKHCLFNDRTILTRRTNRAYNIVANYFNEVKDGRAYGLSTPENHTLLLAVKEKEDKLIFATIVEKHPDLNAVELTTFINRLNDYSLNAIYDIEKPLYRKERIFQ